ncbi:hypothetical protein DH2020_000787 [Rehmannia glutinosa]|uniref:HhH-GPD domain-containing protein n=1 Tax=Rehmannia glutinosa TaxID=99300 RepID=A0ABR0XXL8_REHGL
MHPLHLKAHYLAGNSHSPLIISNLPVRHHHLPPPTAVYTMKRCRQAEPRNKPTAKVVDIEDISFSAKEIPKIRASLLEWYDEYQRDLPWRRISKGKSDVGIEEREKGGRTRCGYLRWMEKWPTIHHLAQASIEEVNEMWAGLGYYRRARFCLRSGAKMIVEVGGEFPKTASSLQMVKGIGNYTAEQLHRLPLRRLVPVPVVDGNVVRVITRLKAISANPKNSTTVKNIWLSWNSATLCSLAAPSCSTCPISHQCQALSLSMNDESVQVTDYPMKVPKAKQRHDFSAVSVVEIVEEGSQSDSRYLLVKRPDEGCLLDSGNFHLFY